MEALEQINKFHEFVESNYYSSLLKSVRKDNKFLVVDFSEIAKFDIELANDILENPEETIKAAELAVEEFDIEDIKGFKIRFTNLPETQKVMIRDIRSKLLGKLMWIEGIVKQKSDVRPQVTAAKFECPSCGNIINVLQLNGTFKEPSKCGCGRKGKFNMISKELVDAQGIVLEEVPETLDGGEQPKRMNVFLKDDLVSPFNEKRTSPGSKVRVVGMIKEVPIISKTGAKSTKFNIIIEANNVEPVEETFYDIDLTEEEKKEILDLAQDPRLDQKLINSIAPSIYGYEKVKEALLMQLMGGVRKVRMDKVVSRGDLHILLVGDPGAGKSAMLKRVHSIAPKGRYVSGKGVSGAGITASVVRDEFLGGWSLEAGALVLASNGLCCLHPDTKIVIDNKIVPIGDVFDSKKVIRATCERIPIELNKLHKKIISFDKNHMRTNIQNAFSIRRKKHNGKITKIEFKSGFSIKLTADHKIIDGRTLLWKEAGEFEIGEKIVSPLKLPPNNNRLLIKDIIGKDCNIEKNKFIKGRSKETLKTDTINADLGYVLGFIYGGGHVSSSKRRTNIQITQSTKHIKYIKKLKKCWNAVMFKPLGGYINTRSSIIRGQKITSTTNTPYYGSRLLGEIYDFFTKDKLKNILMMPDDVLKGFLGGLMDSDSCISTKNTKKENKIYQTQTIEILASNDTEENLALILAIRRLDCYGNLYNKTKSIKSIVISGREDVKTLVTKLSHYSVKAFNFRLIEKKKEISSESNYVPFIIGENICEMASNLPKKFLLEMGIWSTIHSFLNEKREPTRNQLIKILNKTLGLIDGVFLKNSLALLKRDYFLDEITKISEENYSGYVYDLFVPEQNNFAANGIIVHNCIDEMDKMSNEDRNAMHEALEQQTVSISKANIQATLLARTTVLAAANPKFGRFDPYGIIADQIDLPPTLINRFDLIFPIKDLPEVARDEKMASHILSLHQRPDILEPEISTELLTRYISYARQRVRPVLTDGALAEIKRFYLKMRSSASEGEGIQAIPISARQLEALVRLSEASAKIRLSDEVTKKDAKRAVDLLEYCLMQVGLDRETGKIDIDRIATGVTASQRSHIVLVKEIVNELENKIGKTIPIDDVIDEARLKEISEDKVEEAIEKLKRVGEVFEPRRGFISRI